MHSESGAPCPARTLRTRPSTAEPGKEVLTMLNKSGASVSCNLAHLAYPRPQLLKDRTELNKKAELALYDPLIYLTLFYSTPAPRLPI